MTKGMEPTQVALGNLPRDVKIAELVQFLEATVGLVLRCKVKNTGKAVAPTHAFVHFASPEVAREACKLAEKECLVFQSYPLKARVDNRLHNKVLYSSSIISLQNVMLEIGSLISPTEFLVSWRESTRVSLEVDPIARKIRITLVQTRGVDHLRSANNLDTMMEIRLREVKNVRVVTSDKGNFELLFILQLLSPPMISSRAVEDEHIDFFNLVASPVDDNDPWNRSLDIITADKSIGRCLDYHLRTSVRQASAYQTILAFFRDHHLLQKGMGTPLSLTYETKWDQNRVIPFFTVPHFADIPFDLMFLVNVLVHDGILRASSLCKKFYGLLRPDVSPSHIVSLALRQMLSYSTSVLKPSERLEQLIQWFSSKGIPPINPGLIESYMMVRRLIITPTRAVCLAPELEVSNRVIRNYQRRSDCFLRVSFLDENLQQLSPTALMVQVAPIVRDFMGAPNTNRTDLYKRIEEIMLKGFHLCGRHYRFLAFSASQLRDSSAWFFAGDANMGVADIREWMGTFPGGNVAKFAARMGQCFSSTISTSRVWGDEVEKLVDIKRNGYTFSDGCGTISVPFAAEVARSLNLEDNPPSCYQIRYAGYKGVTSVWEMKPQYKLGLRESMLKFLSSHIHLEVVGWSRFLPSYLNRQIITLLSTLQVSNDVFLNLQDLMVSRLNAMLDEKEMAVSVLTSTCAGELHDTALKMLHGGFIPQREPYLRGMLQAIRSSQLEELVQKAKIFVPQGRWLLGCMDEARLLEYGQCFIRVSVPCSTGDSKMGYTKEVITGTVIMAKNPCMHPGDVRVLNAVDVPGLYHLIDCLVFPQVGPRPHSNEASGSDMDGDMYFVSWEPNLIPPGGKSMEPMDYNCPKAATIRCAVRPEHVVDFFMKHMINDSLGRICNAHVVHADRSPKGAMDEDCLELAKLAAMAVDYPKTGKPAAMPASLRPLEYPDFMEKEDAKTYESSKVLGMLFRRARRILPEGCKTGDNLESDPAYDTDLEVPGFEKWVIEAANLKNSYDMQIQGIMKQYSIQDEAQVTTGHVMLGPKLSTRRQGDIKERVKYAYNALRKEFRHHFESPSDGLQAQELEAKASAWYNVTYHPDCIAEARKGKESLMLFLSFPWIVVDYLSAIKARKRNSASELSNDFVKKLSLGRPLVGRGAKGLRI